LNSERELHHATGDCANCGATVSGHFCHRCGQETVLHPPSAREFMHEFIGHYVALEGKLWKSLGLLLFRPGSLTLEYIKGRRVRYVQPLRMYLTFSLVFFAVLKYTAHDDKNVHVGKHTPAASAAAQASPDKSDDKPDDKPDGKPDGKPGKVAVIQEDRPGEFRADTQKVRDWIRSYSPHLADKTEEVVAMDSGRRDQAMWAAFYAYAPYAIFFMMPVFAFYLKVLYLGSGRRYGEHLLFALHANGFAFLTMALIELVPEGVGLVSFVLGLWLTAYLPLAMRRVYGGARTLTGLRWIVLMCLHLLTMVVAILLATAYGVLH
jgi:hypothetical protein